MVEGWVRGGQVFGVRVGRYWVRVGCGTGGLGVWGGAIG